LPALRLARAQPDQPIELGERRAAVGIVQVLETQIDRLEDRFVRDAETLQHQGNAAERGNVHLGQRRPGRPYWLSCPAR